MSVHQSINAPGVLRDEEKSESPYEGNSKSELVFSITDQGDAKDLSISSLPDNVDVAPEVVSTEIYMHKIVKPSNRCGSHFSLVFSLCV